MRRRKRAIRRHHRWRLKKNRKNYYGGNYEGRESKLIDTPTPCSCPMCGNPRRWWNELTKQEKLDAVRCREEMEERS